MYNNIEHKGLEVLRRENEKKTLNKLNDVFVAIMGGLLFAAITYWFLLFTL